MIGKIFMVILSRALGFKLRKVTYDNCSDSRRRLILFFFSAGSSLDFTIFFFAPGEINPQASFFVVYFYFSSW